MGYKGEFGVFEKKNFNKRPRGLNALLELKTQYTRMF